MLDTLNMLLAKPVRSLEELLEYYRHRLPVRVGNYRLDEVGPIMSTGSKTEIAGYLHQIFSFNGTTVEMKNRIDWHTAPDGDLEWNGCLVRQGYLVYLADAYRKSGDETYARCVIAQMLDYIRRVPPYDPEGKAYLDYKKSTWRPFEVAGRAAESWPVILAEVIGSPAITPAAFGEILRSVYQHADFLFRHHWQTGNHACLEVAGLGVISVLFPEFDRSDGWRTYAADFLTGMFDRQFYPDGYSREMSGSYHWVAMRNFLAFYEAACRNGYARIFPDSFAKRLRECAWAEFYQQKPDYSLPVTNDSNVMTRHREQLRKLDGLLGDGILRYRFSEGKEGEAPTDTSHFFPAARLGIMRSDWTSRAVFLSFDMGDWGTNHMNEDQLNVELSAYGRNLLVNSGRWRYTTSPGVEWRGTARYFKTTAAFNSLLVDGLCQMPGNARGTMRTGETFDYAKGVFSQGYGRPVPLEDDRELMNTGVPSGMQCLVSDVQHIREVFFYKPLFFIVRDTVATESFHHAQQLWHMPQARVESREDGALTYTMYRDANVVIRQLGKTCLRIFEGSREPLRGYHCPHYGRMEPAPELEYEKAGNGSIVFETLLFPVEGPVGHESIPDFEKKKTAGGNRYVVRWQGREYAIFSADTGEWNLEDANGK